MLAFKIRLNDPFTLPNKDNSVPNLDITQIANVPATAAHQEPLKTQYSQASSVARVPAARADIKSRSEESTELFGDIEPSQISFDDSIWPCQEIA